MTDVALENALALAALGHSVLPVFGVCKPNGRYVCACGDVACTSPGKHPHRELAGHGLKDASTDPVTIEAWRTRVPDCNFGVVTDRFVLLDVDGARGRDSLKVLEADYGALPLTWRLSTGSGQSLRVDGAYTTNGQHIYFRAPRGKEIRNSAGVIAVGLDVRARGGYAIVAGSRHVSGALYQWLPAYHPNDCDLAPCPAWLLELLAKPKHNGAARPAEEWRALIAAPVREGERNSTLARLAGHLLAAYDADPIFVLELLSAWNEARCAPPLPAAEVERVVASIARAELRKRSGADG